MGGAGKRVLVIADGSVIGRAFAEAALREGASVVLASRNAEKAGRLQRPRPQPSNSCRTDWRWIWPPCVLICAEGGPFHAVAEEGVSFKQIAEVIARRLNLHVVGKSPEEAAEHFGWFGRCAGMDVPTSADDKGVPALADWIPHVPPYP